MTFTNIMSTVHNDVDESRSHIEEIASTSPSVGISLPGNLENAQLSTQLCHVVQQLRFSLRSRVASTPAPTPSLVNISHAQLGNLLFAAHLLTLGIPLPHLQNQNHPVAVSDTSALAPSSTPLHRHTTHSTTQVGRVGTPFSDVQNQIVSNTTPPPLSPPLEEMSPYAERLRALLEERRSLVRRLRRDRNRIAARPPVIFSFIFDEYGRRIMTAHVRFLNRETPEYTPNSSTTTDTPNDYEVCRCSCRRKPCPPSE